MSFHAPQFKLLIQRTLQTLEGAVPFTEAAVQLLMGTAAQESMLGKYIDQVDGDEVPYDDGLGVFQMEAETYSDIWVNYLNHRQSLVGVIANSIDIGLLDTLSRPDPTRMVWDLRYATIMARIHYRRVPEALPPAHNIEAMAAYWKKYYNTRHGAGKPEEFIENYHRYVG